MKRLLPFFLLLLFINLQSDVRTSYYQINIRNYLLNNSQYSMPQADVLYRTRMDSTLRADFWFTLRDFQPYNFLFSASSYKPLNGFSFRAQYGDISSSNPVTVKMRGFSGSLFHRHIGLGFFLGREPDPIYTDGMNFIQNRGIYGLSVPFNVSYTDTTTIFFANRFDNPYFSPYISQRVLGLNHRSVLFNSLYNEFSFTGHNNLLYYNSEINHYSYSYRSQYRSSSFSIGIYGRHLPVNSTGFSHSMSRSGRDIFSVEPSLRITNELGLSGGYSLYKITPEDSSSYERISARVGTAIGFLPRISFAWDYFRYVYDRSITRLVNYNIGFSKSFRGIYFDGSYYITKQDSITNNNLYVNFSYTFPNRAVVGTYSKYNFIDSLLSYSYTNYVRWSIASLWSYEYGIDFGERDSRAYIGNHFNFIFNSENYSLINNAELFYQSGFRFSMTSQLSLKGGLDNLNTGMVSGRIYFDKNNNDLFDGNDTPVSNVTVLLNDSLKVKTGKKGEYRFSFLKPNKYKLSISKAKIPAYYDLKDFVIVEVKNFSNNVIDLPLIKLGSITGYVFYDLNKNGIKEKDEEGIGNIVVRLKDSDKYTYTDAFGYYSISNLPTGTYIVEVPNLPQNYEFVFPNLIMYIVVDKVKADFTVDFGITKELKPVKKKVF
ncbi:MAG: SdrD B-like domain-containing protein [bacterium]|nr:SdrD B-like domain-containing protein [bacterium]